MSTARAVFIIVAFGSGVLSASPAHGQAASRSQTASCVDINSASASGLERIIHIGPARSAEVIALRKQRPFGSVDDLARVSGLGASRLREIKAQGIACVRPPIVSDSVGARPPAGSARNPPPPTQRQATPVCVDLNTATETDLQRITQIGRARARQIIALRQQRAFASVDDLVRVEGIATARLAQIKAQGLACVRKSGVDPLAGFLYVSRSGAGSGSGEPTNRVSPGVAFTVGASHGRHGLRHQLTG